MVRFYNKVLDNKSNSRTKLKQFIYQTLFAFHRLLRPLQPYNSLAVLKSLLPVMAIAVKIHTLAKKLVISLFLIM